MGRDSIPTVGGEGNVLPRFQITSKIGRAIPECGLRDRTREGQLGAHGGLLTFAYRLAGIEEGEWLRGGRCLRGRCRSRCPPSPGPSGTQNNYEPAHGRVGGVRL